jgi:hypothetical protein
VLVTSPFTFGPTWWAHSTVEDPDDGGHTTNGGRVHGVTHARYAECEHYGCRPVVVIDPDDSEQVGSLTQAWESAEDCPLDNTEPMTVRQLRMRHALRSLIAPPKPPEPMGLGAVVEDEGGVRYIRHPGTFAPWRRADAADSEKPWRYWSGITAVKVLSEGVTA